MGPGTQTVQQMTPLYRLREMLDNHIYRARNQGNVVHKIKSITIFEWHLTSSQLLMDDICAD
jgi:hypothetical protein